MGGSGYGRILVARNSGVDGVGEPGIGSPSTVGAAVRAHRTAEAASVRNATVEIVMMAVALGLAGAGLVGTAPA